jgi:hypothetical protein
MTGVAMKDGVLAGLIFGPGGVVLVGIVAMRRRASDREQSAPQHSPPA